MIIRAFNPAVWLSIVSPDRLAVRPPIVLRIFELNRKNSFL
jgi:hypothetical protein